jgi:pimeloyl-ACP methyl ester carboxylesterase
MSRALSNAETISVCRDLIPWEFTCQDGLVLRGYYTEPSGKPVIHFIHGNGFCGLTFELLLSHLQDDYDLFISDGQGHGNSDDGGVYPGWNRSSKYFAEVWQHYRKWWHEVPKIALGHSYGAIMSTLMIAKKPDLFDVGILMDPVYAPPGMARTMTTLDTLGLGKRLPLARQAKIRTGSWPSYQAAWDYFYQRGTFKGWQDDCLKSYLDHALRQDEAGALHLKCPPRIESAIFSAYAKGLWPAIKRIKRPMCMLYGSKTYPFVKKSRPRIHQANLHYDFIEMPGGHCFMQEHPALTAQTIKQKLRFQLASL